MAYCERCDMENCEHTTGAGKRFDASLKDTRVESSHEPRVRCNHAGHGVTIESTFPGQCAGCGGSYAAGSVITHDSYEGGWVAGCCA